MRSLWIALSLCAVAAVAGAQPASPPLTLLFQESFGVTAPTVVGDTPAGRRQSVSITGGTFSGPGFSGKVLPGGGDYQLVRSDGAVEIDAEYLLQTDDGVVIHARHLGTIQRPKDGGAGYFWSTHSFDAPAGKYGWLNGEVFISRIGVGGGKDHPTVNITVWKVG